MVEVCIENKHLTMKLTLLGMALVFGTIAHSTQAQVNTPLYSQHPSRGYSYSVETDAEPKQIWLWETTVSKWHLWDTGLVQATLKGTLNQGAIGTLVDKEGRTSKFEVVAFEPEKYLDIKVPLFLSSMILHRELQPRSDGKTKIYHQVYFQGFLGGLFERILRPKYEPLLPGTVERLGNLIKDTRSE